MAPAPTIESHSWPNSGTSTSFDSDLSVGGQDGARQDIRRCQLDRRSVSGKS